MAIRMEIRASGSFAADLAKLGENMGKAVSAGFAGVAEGAKQDLRRQLRTASPHMAKAANAIRSAVYPAPPKFSPSAAATVFAAGDSADRFLSAFATGALVVPKRGSALAVPLHDFRGFDRRLIGPKSSFWGGKLVFIPPRSSAAVAAQGVIGTLCQKTDEYTAGKRFDRNSKARRAAARHVGPGLIPQFVLIASARMPKMIDPDAVIAAWFDRLPDFVTRATDLLEQQ